MYKHGSYSGNVVLFSNKYIRVEGKCVFDGDLYRKCVNRLKHIVDNDGQLKSDNRAHGRMSLRHFTAHGRMFLSQRALHWLNDILPCAVKCRNDILPCARRYITNPKIISCHSEDL